MQLLGQIVANGRLIQLPFEAVFYVGHIAHDAILGMDFFIYRDCVFSFAYATFKQKLKCINQNGSLCITSCHAQRHLNEEWRGDYDVLSTL